MTAEIGKKPPKSPFSRKLGLVSAAVLFLFCIIVTIQAIWTYDIAIKRGQVIAEKLTEIETNHIELTFNTIQLSLRGQAERYYYGSLFGRDTTDDVEREIKKIVARTPQIAWILATDKNGDIKIVGTKPKYDGWIKSRKKIGEEDFFKFHKQHNLRIEDSKGTSISVSSSQDEVGKNLIIISQPLFKYDGNFDGVMAIAIDANYFFEFFRSVEIGDKIGMAFVIKNGQVIVSSGQDYEPIDVLSVIKNNDDINKSNFSDLTTHKIKLGEDKYIISFKKVKFLPVIVSLFVKEDQVLATWRNDRMTDLVFLMLFTVFGAVLFSLILAMAKQIQRAEESEKRALLANQAKTEFFAKMSHELRTPLNAIIGFSEMIDNGYFGPLNNDKQKERVHDINLCGNHLLQLINDILDYSKGEAGKLEIRDSEVALSKIVEDALRMVREKAKRKNLELFVHVSSELPKILVDERKIKQVMLNLLSNAVKFTPEKGEVKIDASITDKHEILVSVTDNGPGIPEEDIPVALSVFGQVKNRQNTEEEGTGLGLPLCKMLVELHNGKFFLESKVGEWTRASFTIPAARVIAAKHK